MTLLQGQRLARPELPIVFSDSHDPYSAAALAARCDAIAVLDP